MPTDQKKTNPNGANQYLADPRQSLFLSYYLDPKSETFSNALRSALKAGYEEEYAKTITAQMPDWLSESIRELNMTGKAERNLNNYLDMKAKTSPYERIKADVTMFVAERLNRRKYGKEANPQTTNILIQGFNYIKPDEK